MHAGQAHAVRRMMYAAFGLAGTLLAHALASGAVAMTMFAPALWALALLVAVAVGPRGATFRPRGPAGVMGSLIVAQGLLHVVLVEAPWALGVHVHHHGPLISLSAVAAHAMVASVLGVVALVGERLLAALVRVVDAVRRHVAKFVRPRGARGIHLRKPTSRTLRPAAAVRNARSTRGPPVAGIVTA